MVGLDSLPERDERKRFAKRNVKRDEIHFLC